jgi:hypothetical protein
MCKSKREEKGVASLFKELTENFYNLEKDDR